MNKSNESINIFILVLFGIGIFIIGIYSMNHSESWIWFCMSILIALTTSLIGSFFGFLFGIPRVNSEFNQSKEKAFVANTSLEDISDWLTKIIIGVSLTQLYKIPNQLYLLAKQIVLGVGAVTQPINRSFDISFVISLILFYSILGFFFAFFYARLELKKKFVDVEDYNTKMEEAFDLNKRLEEKVDKEKELILNKVVELKGILSKFQKNVIKSILKSEKREYIRPLEGVPFNDFIDIKELERLNVLINEEDRIYKLSEEYKDLTIDKIS